MLYCTELISDLNHRHTTHSGWVAAASRGRIGNVYWDQELMWKQGWNRGFHHWCFLEIYLWVKKCRNFEIPFKFQLLHKFLILLSISDPTLWVLQHPQQPKAVRLWISSSLFNLPWIHKDWIFYSTGKKMSNIRW